ncbi:MAG: SGNH/GDSL hydrolase family protein [Planctomycetota bacterium]
MVNKTIPALLMGSAFAGALAASVFFFVLPKLRTKNLDHVRSYNEEISKVFMKGPASGPPILLKANFEVPGVLKTDSLGLLTPELAQVKTLPRVLVLGDSFTFGYGLRAGEPFCSVIAESLKGKIEIANAAISGFEIQDSAAQFLRFVDKIEPDLVVVTFVSNDLDDSRVFEGRAFGGYVREPQIHELVDGIFASTTNILRLAHGAHLTGEAFTAFVHKFSAGGNYLPHGVGPFARSRWERYKSEFRKIVLGAKQRNAKVILYTFASPALPALDYLYNICSELGVPIFTQEGAFDLGAKENRLDWDPHPNAHANKIFANRLMRSFVTVGLLKIDGMEPIEPLKPNAQLLAFWRNAILGASTRHALKNTVVFFPRDEQANLNQVIAGFEDAFGLIGPRGIVLLHSERAIYKLRIKATVSNSVPDSEERILEIRFGGNSEPVLVTVKKTGVEVDVPIPQTSIEKIMLEKETYLVEVDIRDRIVAAAPPAERKSKLGVNVHRLEVF